MGEAICDEASTCALLVLPSERRSCYREKDRTPTGNTKPVLQPKPINLNRSQTLGPLDVPPSRTIWSFPLARNTTSVATVTHTMKQWRIWKPPKPATAPYQALREADQSVLFHSPEALDSMSRKQQRFPMQEACLMLLIFIAGGALLTLVFSFGHRLSGTTADTRRLSRDCE